MRCKNAAAARKNAVQTLTDSLRLPARQAPCWCLPVERLSAPFQLDDPRNLTYREAAVTRVRRAFERRRQRLVGRVLADVTEAVGFRADKHRERVGLPGKGAAGRA